MRKIRKATRDGARLAAAIALAAALAPTFGLAQAPAAGGGAPTPPVDLGGVTVEAPPPTLDAPPAFDPTIQPTSAPPDLGPFDSALAYPDLSQETFGGLNSLTRNNRSIFDSAQSLSIIDRQSIQAKNPIDMYQALQNEVGVLVQRTGKGQASPYIRGFTGQQILTMLDGVRLNTSILRGGPNQYFNLIDPGMIERIEILRGPGSTAWGADAMGGVINIVSRSPDMNRTEYGRAGGQEVFSTADLASYTRFSGEGKAGAFGVYGGASYLNVNNLDVGGNGQGRQPFTDYSQYAGDVKFVTQVSDETFMSIALNHFEQHDVPRSDRFLPFVLGPPLNTQRPTYFDVQQRDMIYVNYQGLSDSSLFDAFTVTGSYQRNKEVGTETRVVSNTNSTPTRQDHSEFDLATFGVSFAFSKDLEEVGQISYGGDWYHDDVNSSRTSRNPFNAPPVPIVAQFPNDGIYQRIGTFLLWDVDVTERLHMQAGVRYENAGLRGTVAVTNPNANIYVDRNWQDWIGSVGFVYSLTEETNLVGGIYEGYRAPNLSDIASNNTFQQNQTSGPSLAGFELQAEHTITYEVGLKYNGDRFRATAVEYWVEVDNLIGTTVPRPGNPARPTNFANCYQNGTELTGQYLFDDQWSAYGNFWYTYGRNKTENEPLSRMPPAQGTIGLKWTDANRRRYVDVYAWLVNRQDRYATANLTDARFPTGGTPGFGTLNFRAGTTFGQLDRQRISIVGENILDQGYHIIGSGVRGTGASAILAYEFSR